MPRALQTTARQLINSALFQLGFAALCDRSAAVSLDACMQWFGAGKPA
jgi:hypothetical protein